MDREVWYIRGEGGGVNRMCPPFGEGITARLRAGALVRVNEDGSTYTGDAPAAGPDAAPVVPADSGDGTPTKAAPHRPPSTASRPDEAAPAGRVSTADRIAAEHAVTDELAPGAVPSHAADASRQDGSLPAPATDTVLPDLTAEATTEPTVASLAEKRAEEALREQRTTVGQLPMPERGASKKAWVAYASSTNRITNEAAEDLTRTELIERFGG